MDELDPFFPDQTRAGEWRALRIALMQRLAALETTGVEPSSEAEKARVQREIAALKKQVDALLIEEVSQQFAEDAVRVTIAVSNNMTEDESEGEDEGNE
ncbi:MAG: hypothetical protein P4L33_04090 [Capsulimonadaceae bacterium]|nr:hypothetical protein [Capsulimonadaceae bacterium]